MVERYAHLGADHLAPYVRNQIAEEVTREALGRARHKSGRSAKIRKS